MESESPSSFPTPSNADLSTHDSEESQGEPFNPKGQTAIYAISYSPNGKLIATGTQDKSIRIWDSQSGRMLLDLIGHTDTIRALSFSHNGTQLASGSADHTIRIWNTSSGDTLGESWEAHSDYATSVAYSPDDKVIATAGLDGVVRIWDVATRVKIVEITDHPAAVRCVRFSPDGSHLASGCDDHNVRIYDRRTGALVLGPLEGHTDLLGAIAYCPDGTRIASCSDDCTIRIWDSISGNMVLGPLEGHADWVAWIEYSPDGKELLSGSHDTTMRLWDSFTGRLIAGPLRRHHGAVCGLSYSPDGAHFVSGAEDGTIRVWDACTREVVLPVLAEADIHNYEVTGTGPFGGHTNYVTAVAYFPDGKHAASASYDKSIRKWDVRTGTLVTEHLRCHYNEIYSLSISFDGKRLASGAYSSIKVRDCVEWEVILDLSGHSQWVHCVRFSPDAKLLASAGYGGEVFLWDSDTGEKLRSMTGHDSTSAVWAVAFSPDGQKLASCSQDDTLRIWDIHTAEMIAGPFAAQSCCLVFSPDGRAIATGTSDSSLVVLDADTGSVIIGPLKRHASLIHCVAYSPDGSTICTGSDDHTICLWDAKTGDLLLDPLQGHRGPVSSVSFSSDGRRILSGSSDNTLKLWSSASGELVNLSDSDLREEEANSFLDLPATMVPGAIPTDQTLPGDITDLLDLPATSFSRAGNQTAQRRTESSTGPGRLAAFWSRLRSGYQRNVSSVPEQPSTVHRPPSHSYLPSIFRRRPPPASETELTERRQGNRITFTRVAYGSMASGRFVAIAREGPPHRPQRVTVIPPEEYAALDAQGAEESNDPAAAAQSSDPAASTGPSGAQEVPSGSRTDTVQNTPSVPASTSTSDSDSDMMAYHGCCACCLVPRGARR
ncbi:hypothetical protein HYDPIDRAFT_119616 [Hydnomerulius pinastri MD-312]|uniref:EML-like second beta-propeller domain-containing protein n=1 Tax=Hydnomerulius pinastri MD-312 TaxID=994086 RepID=A0A0C9W6I9_9AGAM|nr:hypothetical protein HYDPIDRAFT_119616 [Hydnomerulius pinastri MD-312]